MSKKTISTIIQLILFLGIGIGLVIWRYNAMGIEERDDMFASIQKVRYWWLLPIFIVGFFSHFFRTLRWQLLLKPLDMHPKTANTLFSVLIGYLANTVIPRAGEVVKCTVLAKYEKIPADKMVGTIIAERAFDMVCLLLLIFLVLGVEYNTIAPYAFELYKKLFFNSQNEFKWLSILLVLIVLSIGIFALIRFSKSKKKSKIGQIIANVGEGLKSIALVQKKGLFLLYTFLVWACYTLMAIMGFWAIPSLEGLSIIAGLAIITFGSIGMIVTPGGIGAYPIIVAQVLLLYGVNEGVGTAYGWVAWSANTGVVIILGLLSLILLPIYNRNK